MSCAAALAAVMPCAEAADELPPPIYAVKDATAPIGSNIPKRRVTSSQIPINRSYGQLTPEEQELVKSRYEAMRPLDEPPYPVNGLVQLFEATRDIQRKVLAQGELSMFADVDAQGQVTSISVMQSPDPQLTRAVANVLMLTKFKPAVCRGQPCSMGYPFRMTFAVEH